ncbi:conserved hypothetical protein (putative transposase or invertase) [Lachnospiraceae bacterium RM5]|nr:conserved hypothetical protein (putative transposase or invertase) [Lachnospiraceae bacterium RM5]
MTISKKNLTTNISNNLKKYDDLEFTDDFAFCKILENNSDICKEILELILGFKIKKINVLYKQKTIDEVPDIHGVRLDVYVEDDKEKIYDIEMQTEIKSNIPKRSRFYQSIIDTNILEKSIDYNKLNDSYIIFICKNDLFGENLPIYSFQNRCDELNRLCLKDGAKKIIVNASGNRNNLSKETNDFLDYLLGKYDSSHNNSFIDKIENKMSLLKMSKEWRHEYMIECLKYQDMKIKGEEIGEQRGIEIGEQRGLNQGLAALISSLKSLNYSIDEISDIIKKNETYKNTTKEEITEIYNQ